MRQIQQALHAQAQYLRSIGGSQSDINALSAEWWEWQEKINGTLKNTDDLLNELQGVMSDKLSDLSDQRQNELDAIDAQIDALKQQKDTRDEQLDLEEKSLLSNRRRPSLQMRRMNVQFGSIMLAPVSGNGWLTRRKLTAHRKPWTRLKRP